MSKKREVSQVLCLMGLGFLTWTQSIMDSHGQYAPWMNGHYRNPYETEIFLQQQRMQAMQNGMFMGHRPPPLSGYHYFQRMESARMMEEQRRFEVIRRGQFLAKLQAEEKAKAAAIQAKLQEQKAEEWACEFLKSEKESETQNLEEAFAKIKIKLKSKL